MAEQRSPAERGEPGGSPEPRASHADRDRVVEVLRDAAGDGLLTPAELDERVEAALNARTRSELVPLTADLPAEPGRQAKDLVRIDQRFGDTARTGRWVVPRRMEIKSTAGDIRLDFTEAVISHPTLDLQVELGIGADLLLVIKPGITVDTDDLTMRGGDVKVAHAGDGVPVSLAIVMSGRVRGASVVARFPRRTLWQWLRREPARYKRLTR